MKFIFILFLNIVILSTIGFSQTDPAKQSDIFSTKEEVSASLNSVPCDQAKRLDGVKARYEKTYPGSTVKFVLTPTNKPSFLASWRVVSWASAVPTSTSSSANERS